MINAYMTTATGTLTRVSWNPGDPLPDTVIWVDLLSPTAEEERCVEVALKVELPTHEEMSEIEASSRLYQEDNAYFLTAAVLSKADTDTPGLDPVTFILVGHRLVTIRYSDPLPFRNFAMMCQRQGFSNISGEGILAGLLDAISDRLADLLEATQRNLDKVAHEIFSPRNAGKTHRGIDYEDILRRVGTSQVLVSRVRESLLTLTRLSAFLIRPAEQKADKALARNFKTVARDVLALSDHALFLTSNINFLLDATLGMINIEQTGIIKIFSVAAVVFLPPTLIASIYGMNFSVMPELEWQFGYPFAIGLMILTAIMPYFYFKHKGWL
ncbi:magnesium transporter [Rhodoligotrophos appendicifer]|uniref:magnesium transporter CorA family protein n=1 Tax=Rhodoligotrophos appendicifer TaxID=987056 RepID=UPI0011810D4B|nr:magnesium transporter CorA family protein [Rhodoligotrophos appendicifer]